jgi:hypothetical protein
VTLECLLDGGHLGHVETDGSEPAAPVSRQELRERARMQIGQRYLTDVRVLKEIVCAGAALKPGTEDHHFHGLPRVKVTRQSPEK